MRTRSTKPKTEDFVSLDSSGKEVKASKDKIAASTRDNAGIALIVAAAAVDTKKLSREEAIQAAAEVHRAAEEAKKAAVEAKKAAAAARRAEKAKEAEAKKAAAAAQAAIDAECKRKQEEIRKKFASITYFESTNAKKLFSPKDGETVMDCVKRRIEMLTEIIKHDEDMSFILKYVRKVEHADPDGLTMKRWKRLYHRCQILLAAYKLALRDMPTLKRSWIQCCQGALDAIRLSGIDICRDEGGRSIAKWAKDFSTDELLPNPLPLNKPFIPHLFQDYPRAIEMGRKYCEEYLDELSSRSMSWFMRDDVIPALFKEKWEKERRESIMNGKYFEKRKQKVYEIKKRLTLKRIRMERKRIRSLKLLADPELCEEEKERKRRRKEERKQKELEKRKLEERLERKRKRKEMRERRERIKRTAPPIDFTNILYHPDDIDVLNVVNARKDDDYDFDIDIEITHSSEEEDSKDDSPKENSKKVDDGGSGNDDDDSDSDCSTSNEFSTIDWAALERKEVHELDQKEHDEAFAKFKKRYPVTENTGRLMLKWLGYTFRRETPTDGNTVCFIWYKADQHMSTEGQPAKEHSGEGQSSEEQPGERQSSDEESGEEQSSDEESTDEEPSEP